MTREQLDKFAEDFLLKAEIHQINPQNLGKTFYNHLGEAVTLIGYDRKNEKSPIVTLTKKGKIQKMSIGILKILLKSDTHGTGIFRGVPK